MSLLADFKKLFHLHATLFKSFGLFHEQYRVKHHTVAYHVDAAFLEDAARNRTEHILVALEFQRVSGIRSALETRHHVIARGEHIHDLAFSFIAPLEA